jgi:ATP-binding cassette subfamily B protein
MRQTLIVMSRHIEFDLKRSFQAVWKFNPKLLKKNRTGDFESHQRRCFKSKTVCSCRNVLINTVIRFTIVIVYMYNVSPLLTLYTILPLPLLSYGIFKLSSEINKRSTVFQQYLKYHFLTGISGIRVIKAIRWKINIKITWCP